MRRRTVHAGIVVKVSSMVLFCCLLWELVNVSLNKMKIFWVWILYWIESSDFLLNTISLSFVFFSYCNAINKYYCVLSFIDYYPCKEHKTIICCQCRVRKVCFQWQPREDQLMHQKDFLLMLSCSVFGTPNSINPSETYMVQKWMHVTPFTSYMV